MILNLNKFARTIVLASLLPVLGLTAGCDKQRESVAAAIQPRTAQQVTATVNQLLAEGKFKEARADGESFLSGKAPAGPLAWALAKACAQLGDHDAAIQYASRAVADHAVTGVDVMSEPLLEPVRTDVRLLAFAAGTTDTATSTSPQPFAGTPAAQPAPQATATINAGGIEARAGSVSVKLPD